MIASSPESRPLLEVRFGAVELAVAAGEVVAVVGPTGSGKTALVHAIAGLRPGAELTLAGAPLAAPTPERVARAGVAFVPEGRRVFPSLSVDENITLGAYRVRRDRALVERRRAEVYARFPRLDERRAQRAGTLSGGEQQMLVIARGLMSGPRLLVLDEPSSGLGPPAVAALAEAVARIDAAVLLADLGLALARRLADRIVLLDEGAVVLDAPREPALADPRLGEQYLRGI